ncbi:MAG: T9SS type A sorting domain-containing protein, partial [Calditrichaeota bacterium]|nr:T9SS type A sorting domain-containing protein [Calditrichota bacterium]
EPLVALTDTNANIPDRYYLSQNYPNPFNPITQIRFGLPRQSNVTLKIYNILGQKVKTVLDAKIQAGHHIMIFDATDLGSGVYFYRMQAGRFRKSHKMILLK